MTGHGFPALLGGCMSDAWAQAEEMAEAQRAEAGVFQKWEADGESHVMAFCGTPYARKMHWIGALYEDCAGKDCAHCTSGSRTTLRISLNAYHLAEQRMKIVEGGTRWFADIQKVRKKYGLDTWAFEITRNGAPRDPKTTYSVLPDRQLDDVMRRKISALALHDLKRDATDAARESFADASKAANGDYELAKGDAPVANSDREPTRRDTVPHEAAKEIHGLLQQLSKAQVREFLQVFGIKRVSQLKAVDENKARKFIAALDDDLPF